MEDAPVMQIDMNDYLNFDCNNQQEYDAESFKFEEDDKADSNTSVDEMEDNVDKNNTVQIGKSQNEDQDIKIDTKNKQEKSSAGKNITQEQTIAKQNIGGDKGNKPREQETINPGEMVHWHNRKAFKWYSNEPSYLPPEYLKQKVFVKKCFPDACIPMKQTPYSAGFDLYSYESKIIKPRRMESFDTGISLQIPRNFYGLVSGRSSLGFKHGVFCFSGTIDSDYRGTVKILLANHGKKKYEVQKGHRIAQIIILPIHSNLFLSETSYLKESRREMRGFGHTGK